MTFAIAAVGFATAASAAPGTPAFIGEPPGPVRPGVLRNGVWFLEGSAPFAFGPDGATALAPWFPCGVSTNSGCHGLNGITAVRDGLWYWRPNPSTIRGGPPDLTIAYGDPGDIPLVGDWNDDGADTPGVVRHGIWYLRNTFTTGTADVVLAYGDPGDIPVAGDWDGDGIVTPGVVRNGVWYLRNSLTSGTADVVITYGDPGDIPVVGDWDGDHVDTPGVVRNTVWFIRNTVSSGNADRVFSYGDPGDLPVAGTWNPNG